MVQKEEQSECKEGNGGGLVVLSQGGRNLDMIRQKCHGLAPGGAGAGKMQFEAKK